MHDVIINDESVKKHCQTQCQIVTKYYEFNEVTLFCCTVCVHMHNILNIEDFNAFCLNFAFLHEIPFSIS